MFIGRENELFQLQSEFNSDRKSAVLVYGKRRIGKSTLILEASRSFEGTVINFLCIKSTYEGNVELLGNTVCKSLHLPSIHFQSLQDIIDFLSKQNQKFLLILDEYQYLKETKKKNEMDSYMQSIIDFLPSNIKIVLCGSYIPVMKELILEENPLFGRFSLILHIEEFDYYDASLFYPDASVNQKIENYAIFGGSPFVLSCINSNLSLKENIKSLLLKETGILHSYIENIMLKEIQKTYDVRIFEVLGNGKKKYSDIASKLGDGNGLLDKQLKILMNMESIRKTNPINKVNDKKKQFYTIHDNLMRFYFSYVFGNTGIISRIGEEAYYQEYIEPSINHYISLRFEDICCQYFARQTRLGLRYGIYDIGSYWYDDPSSKTNGEFDCVLKRKDHYDIYECKFFQNPMDLEKCKQEERQIRNIPDMDIGTIGFICNAGFSFMSNQYDLLDGETLFK